MLLQEKQTGNLVEVLDLESLFNPAEAEIQGRIQDGQEEQDPTPFSKTVLLFPSGEDLPLCWRDADYRKL
ncbi:MAG: acetyltransferase [Leptolyngbyaceae cyanobacterium CSU_1_3]|nr:acetyltransferase [Leptolyngbyaceae cyanobacterium CSU_1_3]